MAASEAARDREMHRYYQPWLQSFLNKDFEETAAIPPRPEATPYKPRSSKDKALTAFAQLGCLRMNVRRCVVTLLGSQKQYILAEATQTLSLMNDKTHSSGDALWFGNSYIPRSSGISADVLRAQSYTAHDEDGSSFSTPAVLIKDIVLDDKYKSRGYAGQGVNFYCGVPITTQQGHVIGAYTVVDDKPRDSVTATQLQFLEDMTKIVMKHLEVVKSDCARKRGERLINGLGGFIEGTMPQGYDESMANTQDTTEPPPKAGDQGDNQSEQPGDQATRPEVKRATISSEFRGLSITDADPSTQDSKRSQASTSNRPGAPDRTKSSALTQSKPLNAEPKPNPRAQRSSAVKNKAMQQSQEVFDRAAAVLRYCLGSDGVVFVNGSSANLSSGSRMDAKGSVSKMQHNATDKRRRLENLDRSPKQSLKEGSVEPDSSIASDDSGSTKFNSDSSTSPHRRQHHQKCEIIGASVLDFSNKMSISDQSLRRLVQRHPDGKCFLFDQDGKPSSSDESSEAMSAPSLSEGGQIPGWARHFPSANSLQRALPKARRIIFLPLWDGAKERWHAGLVAWSNDATTLTNIDEDLVYLKAFSNAIMNEVNRLDLILADTAKSTFLANISHELRSPLHGILGSIEFLHDTALDDFQSSMVIAVETCGKTLLDTVNHVLDYAKIHNLTKSHRAERKTGGLLQSQPEHSLTEDFDMAIVVEEAVEAVYAGQVFRTANADALDGKSPVQTAASRAMQQRQERKANISKGSAKQQSQVQLTLNIDDHTDWAVRSQPGAVRRVVMNILGNALKYTPKGSIDVTLEIDRSRSKNSSNLHMQLRIADTGRGMSDDFMRNHAFTAFSQEDSLATGTGLGLSIVRQIVDSLGGKIGLQSEKDVGTEVRIWLSIPKSQKDNIDDSEDNLIPEMRETTTDQDLCMLLPELEKDSETIEKSLVPMPTVESSMRNLLSQWFRMKVTTRTNMSGISPDFFLYPEPPTIDHLLYLHSKNTDAKEVPVIILTTNAFEAASLRSNGIHTLTEVSKVIEIIPQPCGPQKLAKVLHRCMQRLAALETQPKRSAKAKNSTEEEQKTHQQKAENEAEHQPAPGNTDSQANGTLEAERGRVARHPADGSDGVSKAAREARADQSAAQAPKPSSIQTSTSDEDRSGSSGEQRTKADHPEATTTTDSPSTYESVPETPIYPAPNPTDGPRVLVVDDNHINLHLLVTFVRKTGHPYASATDGLKALEAYKHSRTEDGGRQAFKFILMDISMPVMNGIAATKAIRQFEEETGVQDHERATIIALTGMGSETAQREARDAGFDQFLSKPVKFKDLVKLLR